MIKIKIDNIVPMPKLRHRSAIRNSKIILYTPSKTKEYEDVIKLYARNAIGNRLPLKCPLKMAITFCFLPPKSWSQKKKDEAIEGGVSHCSKPDLDNLIKAIKDALNNIVYEDDRLICKVKAFKKYANKNGIYIEVDKII